MEGYPDLLTGPRVCIEIRPLSVYPNLPAW